MDKYLGKAKYEMIDNGKTFYGEIKELKGVWATGKTLESCRNNLHSALEGWLILRLKKGLHIPNFKYSKSTKKLSVNKNKGTHV